MRVHAEKEMTLKDFEMKYGKVEVVADLNKHLVQLTIGSYKGLPQYNLTDMVTVVYMLADKTSYSIVGSMKGEAVVSVLPAVDNVRVKVKHANIEYNNTLAKSVIDSQLAELTALKDSVVTKIITYFMQNTIVFKHPCVIENPTDTMAGGITITQIRKGQAIEATNEYEHASYDVIDLDDVSLLRLYEWQYFED